MPKKPPAPSDVADKFMLRLPEGMRDRIAAEAEKNKRSMNAEIIARLEASFSNQLEPGGKRLDQLIYEMAAEMMEREGGPVTIEIRPKAENKKQKEE